MKWISTGAAVVAALLLSASPPALAQTQGSLAVKDANGAGQTLCNVTSATGSVLVQCANLYVQGAQVGTGNPVPVTVLTAPLPTNAATASGVAAVVSALGSPFQTGGSIGNTAFGISGNLPAFAATPTVNLGTLNGAATSALQTTGNASLAAIVSALGSPLQAGGGVAVTALPALSAGSALIGSVQPAITAPAVLTSGTAYNFTTSGTVRVQVDTLSGGDSETFAGSVASGGTTYPLQVMALSGTFGTIATSITAPGAYLILGAGGLFVTPTKVGSASTPVITASASQ